MSGISNHFEELIAQHPELECVIQAIAEKHVSSGIASMLFHEPPNMTLSEELNMMEDLLAMGWSAETAEITNALEHFANQHASQIDTDFIKRQIALADAQMLSSGKNIEQFFAQISEKHNIEAACQQTMLSSTEANPTALASLTPPASPDAPRSHSGTERS